MEQLDSLAEEVNDKQKMYIDVPKTNRRLTRICREFDLTEKQEEFKEITRFTFLTELD